VLEYSFLEISLVFPVFSGFLIFPVNAYPVDSGHG